MRVAGILLGGGKSTRFGSDKLAAQLGGRRLLDIACDHFLEAGLDPVVFVGRLTPQNPRVLVAEPGPAMIDTLRSGLRSIPTGRFAFAPADMPALRPELIRELLAAWEAAKTPFLIPNFRGRRGHPAFAADPQVFFDLGDAREVWQAVDGSICNYAVETADILFDVDTPEDLAAAGSEASRRACVGGGPMPDR